MHPFIMRTDHLVKAESKNFSCLSAPSMCQAQLHVPVRVELCCFVVSKVHRWWCLLSALLMQLMLVCCLLSYCLARALKVQSDKIAKRNGKSPIHFPFFLPSNQHSSYISFWQFIFEWNENLNYRMSNASVELNVL